MLGLRLTVVDRLEVETEWLVRIPLDLLDVAPVLSPLLGTGVEDVVTGCVGGTVSERLDDCLLETVLLDVYIPDMLELISEDAGGPKVGEPGG